MTFDEIINGISGQDPSKRLSATQAARKVLSKERNPPINAIIQYGVVEPLVAFLDHSDW